MFQLFQRPTCPLLRDSSVLKYKDRFLDFDAIAFIPLLEERFGDIKNGKLINTRKYEQR